MGAARRTRAQQPAAGQVKGSDQPCGRRRLERARAAAQRERSALQRAEDALRVRGGVGGARGEGEAQRPQRGGGFGLVHLLVCVLVCGTRHALVFGRATGGRRVGGASEADGAGGLARPTGRGPQGAAGGVWNPARAPPRAPPQTE